MLHGKLSSSNCVCCVCVGVTIDMPARLPVKHGKLNFRCQNISSYKITNQQCQIIGRRGAG